MPVTVELNAPFVSWNDTISATEAAVQFNTDLVTAGHEDVLNLGQGREIWEPSESLFPKGYDGTHGTAYNADAAGSVKLRKAAADYVKFFLGIPANQDNTFVLQQNGRSVLSVMLTLASTENVKANGVGLPIDRWPMYDVIVKTKVRAGSIEEYESPTGSKLEAEISSLLKSNKLFSFVTNTPHNPTGKNYSIGYMEALGKELDEINRNAKDGDKTWHILDIPYFYAQEPDPDPSAPYFKSGLHHVTKQDSPTPWAAIISESKALMANPGLCILVVRPDMAAAVKKALSSSIGVSYDKNFFAQVEICFDPSVYGEHAAHYGALREKYIENRETLQKNLPEQLVDGDPGMTALTIMKNVLDKKVVYKPPSGIKRSAVIDSSVRLAEYFGNVAEVVTVPNGTDNEGNPKLRFALAQDPKNFSKAMLRITKAYNLLRAEYN